MGGLTYGCVGGVAALAVFTTDACCTNIVCISVLMSLICFCRAVIFCEISVPIVWLASVSWEKALEFAANAVPKFDTVSSNVVSSQSCCAFCTLAPYPSDVAVVSVSSRRLYASCHHSWKIPKVRSTSPSDLQSLYSELN